MPAVVKCPTCGTDVAWVPDNKFRPFCSERCKQIDLGAWASEKYVIGGKPGETSPDQPEDEDD
ncbi:pilus assembly protein [Cupriavidus sp. UYMSc13B]|nr:pilus assembly protein [Cupriavidus sp. UYMSc13B]